jgi:hypothetical protein
MYTQICVGFRVNFAAWVTQSVSAYGGAAWETIAVTYMIIQARNTLYHMENIWLDTWSVARLVLCTVEL